MPIAGKDAELEYDSRETLDGQDRCNSISLVDGPLVPARLQCQQGGSRVIFLIMGIELVSPFWVPSGVKIPSEKVCGVSD